MNNIPYQFHLDCTKAQVTLASHRTFHHDIVWPVAMCFESLVRQMLLLFLMHEMLEDVQVTCLVQPCVEEDSFGHKVIFNQHLKLTTTGASVFASFEDKMAFLAQYAPVHLMGSGTFKLSRTTPLVASTLRNLTDTEAVEANCMKLTKEAFAAFKFIETVVSSSYNQG